MSSVLITILMTGCWNYTELDTVSIVAGIAIDKGYDHTGYHLTFETLDVSGGGGASESPVKPILIESDGDTIFDAARNAIKRSDKRLYFGTCETVIISDELAREGIAKVLDWLNRDSEPRETIDLFISKEKTAKEVMEQKSLGDTITSFALSKINKNNPKALSKATSVQLYKANNLVGGEGISLVLPALDIVNNQDNKSADLAGTALFKKDKLLGYLESDESKYLALIKNEVQGGLILVNIDSDVPNVTLEIAKNKTKITPIMTGQTPKIKIDVVTEVALAELETSEDLATKDGIYKTEMAASEVIEANMMRLITKVQKEYGSDIFGFGSVIYKNHPDDWTKLKPQWEQLFPSLNIEVSAKVKIRNTAQLQKMIKIGE